jgi:hypothetical protein
MVDRRVSGKASHDVPLGVDRILQLPASSCEAAAPTHAQGAALPATRLPEMTSLQNGYAQEGEYPGIRRDETTAVGWHPNESAWSRRLPPPPQKPARPDTLQARPTPETHPDATKTASRNRLTVRDLTD